MRKEIELNGCIEIPPEKSMDEFIDEFLALIESKGWYFGGGIKEYSEKRCLTNDVPSIKKPKK